MDAREVASSTQAGARDHGRTVEGERRPPPGGHRGAAALDPGALRPPPGRLAPIIAAVHR